MDAAYKFGFNILMYLLIAGLNLLLAFPFKWCWNYTLPWMFKFPYIEWGHAFCLLWVLAHLRTAIVDREKKQS